jgi:hypothetical protein
MRRELENLRGPLFPLEETEEYWKGFFGAYPGVKRWREQIGYEFDMGERETRTRTGRGKVEVDTKPKRWNDSVRR